MASRDVRRGQTLPIDPFMDQPVSGMYDAEDWIAAGRPTPGGTIGPLAPASIGGAIAAQGMRDAPDDLLNVAALMAPARIPIAMGGIALKRLEAAAAFVDRAGTLLSHTYGRAQALVGRNIEVFAQLNEFKRIIGGTLATVHGSGTSLSSLASGSAKATPSERSWSALPPGRFARDVPVGHPNLQHPNMAPELEHGRTHDPMADGTWGREVMPKSSKFPPHNF